MQLRIPAQALDSFQLPDSLDWLPGSLQILQSDGQALADSLYRLEGRRLIWSAQLPPQQVELRFRRLSKPLKAPYRQKELSSLEQGLDLGLHIIGQPYTYNPFEADRQASNEDKVNYSGSFVRGLSVGNRQDLILNSALNLQLSGQAGGVEITGAISDNNIPIQPQGNTQQLQDFDRLYLQFKLRNTYLQAGDWDIQQSQPSYFLQYQRRIQGGIFKTKAKLPGKASLQTDLGFALSRGKFARNSFLAQEGNQGPYRLRGNNGETWLVVIAGTERVYLDGQLLQRGTDQDYVIDYNLGEITFMPRQPMTKDKRLVIEFSYTDLNYQRSIFSSNWVYQQKQTTVHFHLYSEQDAKYQSNQSSLDPDSLRALLQRSSNQGESLLSSSLKPWNPNTNNSLIRYQLRDTLINGLRYDSILVYTPDSNQANLYTAQFSFLGPGQGHYIRRNSNANNGSIYDWIAPDPLTGQARGTHAPVIQIIPPQQRQVYNLGLQQGWKGGKILGELALSRHNNNTFQMLDPRSQQGYASRVQAQQEWLLWQSTDSNKQQLILQTQAYYEWVHQRFQGIEPFRAREFQRDWALPQDSSQEHWLKSQIQVRHSKIGQLRYEWSFLQRQSGYRGQQHGLSSQGQLKGLQWQGHLSQLQSERNGQNLRFLRPKLDLSYQLPFNLKIGAFGEREQLAQRLPNQDSLGSQSLYFNVLKTYASLDLAPQQLKFYAHAQRRWDYAAKGPDFRLSTLANELNLNGHWQSKNWGQWAWNFNYRQLLVPDSSLSTEQPKTTYLGRLNYDLGLWRGLIQTNLIYELGAGQQQRLDYQYVQVDRGLGTHIWIDRNGDGQQQQIEFEQAPFADQADYIRAIAPSGSFIRTNDIAFNYSLEIQPKRYWNKAKKGTWQERLGRLNARSQARLERKTTANTAIQALNPFQQEVPDTSLVSLQNTWNNQLFWNRSHPVYGLELSHHRLAAKNTLLGGWESRSQNQYSFRPRYRWSKQWQSQGLYAFSQRRYSSDVFAQRNYEIEQHEAQFSLIWQRQSHWRLQAQASFKQQQNSIGDKEQAQHWENSLEAQWAASGKGNLRARLAWTQINFQGQANSPVGFTLLQGLQPGSNWQWSLQFDRNLSKLLQLSLGYEGRKTGDAPVNHLGRMQIRANF
jgi:hypothetical protein